MTNTEHDTRDQKLRDLLTIRVVDFLERLEKPSTQGQIMSDDDGLTRSEQKIRNLVAIRSYLRDRVDELVAERLLSQANAVAAEVSRLNLLIAEAEAAE